MSNILTARIRNHIESSLKDLLHLNDCPNDEQKMFSRGITAICLAGLSNTTYPQIVKYVTDGTKDNGIDGVFYDAGRNKLYLVQSKWSSKGSGTIETGDLRKFISGVYDLLNEEWKNFNDRFKTISSEISMGIKNDPEIVLVAAYNSDNELSHDCRKIVDEFLNENNSDSQDVVSFQIFDLKHLVRTIKTVKSGEKSDVEVNLLQWGEHKDPYYSIYGKVSCADVAEWYKSHGDLLFTENIRNTLSDSEINIQIENALLNDPTEFWYLNNGITAIADQVIRKPIGLGDQKESSYWNVANIKVVNGAQTTSSIAKAYLKNPKAIRKAYVPLKIISLENAPLDIANKITTATNTQNKVEAKDFLSLDPTQESLAEAFKKIGIQYCYRRGEKIIDSSKGLDVQELATVLAVSSSNIGDVVIAKRNIGSLTDPNGHYPKLFSHPIDAQKAWKLVEKWRAASRNVESFGLTLNARDAQLAVHGNRFIEHILLARSPNNIDTATISDIHQKLSKVISELYSDSYLAVLFKNTKKCGVIKESLIARL